MRVLEPKAGLLHDLRTTPHGLYSREAQRRLAQYGPNAPRRQAGTQWPRELAHQLTDPLALLLWLAAGLSLLVGNQTVAVAVVLVIVLNAAFAFIQELQAERAVEALAQYMPQRVTVLGTAVAASWPRSIWFRATSCCWRRASGSPPTCVCSAARWRSTSRR